MKIFLRIIHFLILLVFLIVQVVFLGQFRFYGAGISILFVAVIAVSIIDGYVYGVLYGFFFGFLMDMLLGQIAGVNALVFSIAAYTAYRIYKLGFKPRTLTYVIIVPIVSLIDVIIPNLVYYIFGFGIRPFFFFVGLFLQPAINTVLLFPVFYLFKLGSLRKEEIGFLYKKKI